MRVLMAVGVVVMFANTAHARQDILLEVSGAAGYAEALHGDLDFGGPAVSGTARVRVSPHVALEAHVGYWQHTGRDRFLAQGEVVETSTRYAFPSATISVVAVSNQNAHIGPYGGAGVGVFINSSATSRARRRCSRRGQFRLASQARRRVRWRSRRARDAPAQDVRRGALRYRVVSGSRRLERPRARGSAGADRIGWARSRSFRRPRRRSHQTSATGHVRSDSLCRTGAARRGRPRLVRGSDASTCRP